MARIVPIAEIQGPYAVRYTWSGMAPFDVWMHGEKVIDQSDSAMFVAESPLSPGHAAIEVRDADSIGEPESLQFSPRLRLQWRGQRDAAYYLIQRYDGSAWETRQIAVETGRGYYRFSTTAEADGATVQWRVVAEDAEGNQGEVAGLTRMVVCNPVAAAVVGTYDDGTGDLTIAAAV